VNDLRNVGRSGCEGTEEQFETNSTFSAASGMSDFAAFKT